MNIVVSILKEKFIRMNLDVPTIIGLIYSFRDRVYLSGLSHPVLVNKFYGDVPQHRTTIQSATEVTTMLPQTAPIHALHTSSTALQM